MFTNLEEIKRKAIEVIEGEDEGKHVNGILWLLTEAYDMGQRDGRAAMRARAQDVIAKL